MGWLGGVWLDVWGETLLFMRYEVEILLFMTSGAAESLNTTGPWCVEPTGKQKGFNCFLKLPLIRVNNTTTDAILVLVGMDIMANCGMMALKLGVWEMD